MMIFFIPREFFIPALADGLLLEFERPKVFSISWTLLRIPVDFHNSLDCLHLSFDF